MQILKNTSVVSIILLSVLFVTSLNTFAQTKGTISFTISMNNPQAHYFHVVMNCSGITKDTLTFKMPVWMPGYYQIMNYANNVENFHVSNTAGKEIKWERVSSNAWNVFSNKTTSATVSYDVKATVQFVAANYLDEQRGYISPCGIFLYLNDGIDYPATVAIKPYANWRIATGLDSVAGKLYTYTASNFNVLYDCPILMGNLEELPSFTVNGVKHKFIGYKLGDFNREKFMNDLKKVVESGINIIGDIPYKQYTFLAIGPGRGGIEHLNSCTISFDGKELNTTSGKQRMLSFIAHEYFHHYNVKRIRPFELGPFDYDKENRTNLLWVSEGFTVYYEYLMLKRAGLISTEDLLHSFQSSIEAYENNPGHLHQSLTQASYETWSDGPFGNSGNKVNRTISYYDKGPAIGLLIDFTIRHATNNSKSLDDVMRLLYKEYYQQKQRGFSDAEFQQACETIADTSLTDIFEYVNTTKEIDYNKYLTYAGLTINITPINTSTANTATEITKRNFQIMPINKPDELQQKILKSWLGE